MNLSFLYPKPLPTLIGNVHRHYVACNIMSKQGTHFTAKAVWEWAHAHEHHNMKSRHLQHHLASQSSNTTFYCYKLRCLLRDNTAKDGSHIYYIRDRLPCDAVSPTRM